MRLSIIIPAYNESSTIAEVVAQLERVKWEQVEPELILVNDGSTDGTFKAMDGFKDRYRVIHHATNSGKSAAIRSGLAHATGDFTIIQDADLECDPDDIKKILDFAISNQSPVVYGSRRIDDGKVARSKGIWYYHLGGVYLTMLANILYGTSLTDEPVAYKLIRTDILKSLDLRSEGFGFCPEVTAKLARRGIQIPEVAISYIPRTTSQGKKIRLKDALVATCILLKHRFVP